LVVSEWRPAKGRIMDALERFFVGMAIAGFIGVFLTVGLSVYPNPFCALLNTLGIKRWVIRSELAGLFSIILRPVVTGAHCDAGSAQTIRIWRTFVEGSAVVA